MTMHLVVPRFQYSAIDDWVMRVVIRGVTDPATGRTELFPVPRSFIYTRTTSEALLGLYEYELLAEETPAVSA